MYGIYMVTFTINIPPYTPNVSIYTSTMDPMGYGVTPLISAAQRGIFRELSAFLHVESGANPHAIDTERLRMGSSSHERGHAEVVRYLGVSENVVYP